jgi:hypothetical protein
VACTHSSTISLTIGCRWLGCGAGILLLALGAVLDAPAVAIGGAIVCGAFCLDMVRMMVVRPRRS